MKISFFQLNRGGLTKDVILHYQNNIITLQMIKDISNGHIMPIIELYPPKNSYYTIADGIHRICAYLYLGILEFEYKTSKT